MFRRRSTNRYTMVYITNRPPDLRALGRIMHGRLFITNCVTFQMCIFLYSCPFLKKKSLPWSHGRRGQGRWCPQGWEHGKFLLPFPQAFWRPLSNNNNNQSWNKRIKYGSDPDDNLFGTWNYQIAKSPGMEHLVPMEKAKKISGSISHFYGTIQHGDCCKHEGTQWKTVKFLQLYGENRQRSLNGLPTCLYWVPLLLLLL